MRRQSYSFKSLTYNNNFSHHTPLQIHISTISSANTGISGNAQLKVAHTKSSTPQKDKQVGRMQQKGSELQRQSTQLWDKYRGLLATIRREDGSGTPTAIAKKIRENHSPNAVGAASQGRHTCAHRVSALAPEHAFETEGHAISFDNEHHRLSLRGRSSLSDGGKRLTSCLRATT